MMTKSELIKRLWLLLDEVCNLNDEDAELWTALGEHSVLKNKRVVDIKNSIHENPELLEGA